jgi:HAE1 family hydrophobic/amphiphilic exporter-1
MWLSRVLARFNTWFNQQAERYKRVVGWALDHRWSMVGLAVVSFVGALALPATGTLGAAFFPVTDESEFFIAYETPPGSNLQYSRIKAQELARLARAKPEVVYTYTTVGGQSEAVDAGNVFVKLKPKAERVRSQQLVEAELRQEMAALTGVTGAISTGFMGGFKQIQIELQGPDVRELQRLADEVAAVVKTVPGAVDVGLSTKGQKPELDVQVDRGLAGSLGLTVGEVAQALRPAFAGIDAGDWIDPSGETRDVTVRIAPESRKIVQDLESLPLMISQRDGRQVIVPLGQVARVSPAIGPARIDHLDRDRVIAVQANTQGRPLSEVIANITTSLQQVALAPGYTISQGGEAEDQQEVFGRIMIALGVAVMLMYFVLVVQFGSFLDPFSILLSLPLSLIGVMLGLLVTGATLNLMSMIGVILLMGIVAKNAILLIDFAKWSEETGMPRREAIIQAGRVRLRPILMTTFALIAGMIPVAIGSGEGADFRSPLGVAVIGGVLTSTVLTLLVIPTVYEVLSDTRDWLKARFTRGSTVTVAAPHAAPRTSPQPEH